MQNEWRRHQTRERQKASNHDCETSEYERTTSLDEGRRVDMTAAHNQNDSKRGITKRTQLKMFKMNEVDLKTTKHDHKKSELD